MVNDVGRGGNTANIWKDTWQMEESFTTGSVSEGGKAHIWRLGQGRNDFPPEACAELKSHDVQGKARILELNF